MAERPDRRRAAIAAAVLVAVLALGAAAMFVPWLTRARDATDSTPVRTEPAAVQTIALRGGQRACLDQLPFDVRSRIARVTIVRAPRAAGRLTIEATAVGYRAIAAARVPARVTGVLDMRFPPPSRPVVGTFCLRNAGRPTIALGGTAEAWALTRSTMTLDGRRQPQAFSLTLLEAGRRSLLARVPQLVDRAAALGAVGPWLLWLLIPLLLAGVPAAVTAALWLALRATSASGPSTAAGGAPPPPSPGPAAAPRSGGRARA